MAVLLITAIIVIIYFVYHFVSTAHSYWAKKGVNGPKPHPVFGNINLKIWTRKESWIALVLKLYQQYPNEKVVGAYLGLTPLLIVRDPDLMKIVLIKDFASFVNRGLRVGSEPILRNVFAADGDEWKTLRQKLTPIFTTGKLKGMMPLLNSCVEKYTTYLNTLIEGKTARDVRKLNMKYTMKTITSVAFGIDVNTFTEETTQFESMANNIFNPNGLRRFMFLLSNICPEIIEKLNVRTASPDVAKFFLKLVKEIVEERLGKPKVRNDFMDLMTEMKEQGLVTRAKDERFYDLEITHELITAQAIVFYAAGFETSSGTMSFLMYELALNPGAQARCHEEIDKVMEKYKGQLDYDALKELYYVSMAMDETLRKYPILGILLRQCVSDSYTFKDINLSIKKGTKVWLPVMSLHMDPRYFPDPEKFDPERFLPENKEIVQDYYMPFGDGPRNCIGLRFARVQSLLGIAHFLHRFRVSPCEKTPKKIRLDPRQATLVSVDGVWLNIERRKSIRVPKGYPAH